ncbi:MAG: cytochrome c [Acidimicrobiia bacterium]|nr:cytochrome c [Acidimicrobiia bacterium]
MQRILLALLMLFVVSGSSRTTLAQQPTAKQIEAGAALYRKVGCFQCHVNEGQGGANGPRLGPNPIPLPRFIQYVRKPAGDMPPYSAKVLSERELGDIYAFLQTRKAPPPVNTIPQLAP